MIEITIDKRHATAEEAVELERQPGYTNLLSALTHHGREAGIRLTILEKPPNGFALRVIQNSNPGALDARLVRPEDCVAFYDEIKLGHAPTQDEAKRILADLKNGNTIVAPLCEPGAIERLERIANGETVSDDYFRGC